MLMLPLLLLPPVLGDHEGLQSRVRPLLYQRNVDQQLGNVVE
jgi:hypothetical protein